jgi:hypothetical protein
MKVLIIFFITIIIIGCSDKSTNPDGTSQNTTHELFINEFLAKNDSSIKNELGDYADWIELYNPQDTAIDIGGFYVSDNNSNHTKYKIPVTNPSLTTIQPKSFLLLWADNELGLGELHLDFKLAAEGEYIFISRIVNNKLIMIDSISFGLQQSNISSGRYPDGANNWQYFTKPTPGEPNK